MRSSCPGGTQGLTKKELLNLTRERDKLHRALGGIKEMGALPDILFVIDTNREQLAIREAVKLQIPVVAILDSNSDPQGITYPIPGNDDAMRAIALYCDLVGTAVLHGLQAEQIAAGRDIGEAEEGPVEPGLDAGDGAGSDGAGAAGDGGATGTDDATGDDATGDGATGDGATGDGAAAGAGEGTGEATETRPETAAASG